MNELRINPEMYTLQDLEKILLSPDTMIQLAENLRAEQEKSRQLMAKIEQDEAKVAFTEFMLASKRTILIGELAKLLKHNGIKTCHRSLFGWMRENGFLIKHGDSRNMPTQRAMDMGLFEVKESTMSNPDGSIRITRTTKVTGKGQIYFVNVFRKTA